MEIDLNMQSERINTVEDDVDEWDDKITALEVANVDIQARLMTIEETIIGAVCQTNKFSMSFTV